MQKVLFLSIGRINYDCDINFFEPLKKLFSTVINYNYFTRVQEIGEPAMNREVLALVHQERPDCVFVHSYRHEIFKNTLRQVTSSGIPTVIWFSDDHWRFDNYSRYWRDVSSYSVTTDHESVAKYQALGIPIILSQWAANPDYYHPMVCNEMQEVSFVGARTPYREQFIEGLKERGIEVNTFGRDWPGGYISFEEMVRVFSCSRINLNFGAYWGGREFKQIKGRVFEVIMSGGLLLTDYVPGLESYFEINREILCYESIDQAAELIDYYLSHEDERRAVAQAGYQRARRDHTWQARLQTLFDEVERREATRKGIVVPQIDQVQVNPISEFLPLDPPRAHVLEVQVLPNADVTCYMAQSAQTGIAADDLRDGIVFTVLNNVEFSAVATSTVRIPTEMDSQDLIFALKTIDQLDSSEAEIFWNECVRCLAPTGLLIGSSRLWYAADSESVPAHKHRGHRVAHTPTQLKTQLSRHFKAIELVEVHRPLGPMGPYVVFLAAHNPQRLKMVDVQTLLQTLRKAASEYAPNGQEMRLLWSSTLHDRGLKQDAFRLALDACRLHPGQVGGWKALLRAMVGRTTWRAFRESVRLVRGKSFPV